MIGTIRLGANALYAFRLADGGVALIDAGPDLPGTWGDLATQLRGHGVAISDVRLVIVTHAHADHAGLAAHWASEGAQVLCGSADVPALRTGAAGYVAARAAREAEVLRHGCPEAIIEVIGARPRTPYGWEGCADIEAAPDGARFELDGGRAFRVIAAPGHTPGNLVVAIEGGDGLALCSGDTLLPDTIPTPGLHFLASAEGARWPSLPRFLESVRKLARVETNLLLPGHGEPLEGAPAAGRPAARFVGHHERRAWKIRAALEPRPATAFEVARVLFPRLPTERLGQALTEVIGHFDLLLEQGLGSLETERDGLVRMHLVS